MVRTINITVGNDNTGSGNITGSFNRIYKSDEDAQLMRWLSPLEPSIRHEGVSSERFDGVGDWFLEMVEFREWRGSEGGADKAVLFCSGNPGVGKTYLSSLVMDSLCDQARKEYITVAGFYCDYLARQEHTINNMMGAILKQLLDADEIPNYIREAFKKAKNELGGRRLRLPDLMEMLRTAIASLGQVFICVDALDECLPKHLPELLESLRDIVRESPNIRMFLTGRPHVGGDVQRYFRSVLVIPISPSTDDVRNYLERRLDRDAQPEAMNDDLRAEIIRVIVERISDIFLLVSLNIDAILEEVTIRQRRKKLEAMIKGHGLSDAYTATLTRLKEQKGKLGLKVLMWVLYSERPLRAKELRHALGVEVGSPDLDVENVPALRALLVSCLGLVVVEGSSSTVRLVHYTLKEHLSSDPTLFPSPHSEIAEVCLTYLNFGSVRDLSPTLRLAPSTTPFLEYASHYWGNHARMGMTENVKKLALRFLDKFDEHISAQLLLLRYHESTHSPPYYYGFNGPRGFTGLHGAAFFGLVRIISAVLEMKEWDVNATDDAGLTAIVWAIVRGHEQMVKMLLERESVNPDHVDTKYGRTPLSWVAQYGHEAIVKMLLERESVNPDHVDTKYGRTPLSWAAEYRNEGVVKMLLEREGVNPDHVDTVYGRTPLSWAAEGGHEGVLKLLLEREGVNPDHVDTKYGRTPLSWATKNGNEGVFKMLLERVGVNPDHVDTLHGRTPLSRAAQDGCEAIVKILLERDSVNPDHVDTKYGRTPLSLASQYGHEGVVKMLLEREGVNPDHVDTEYGRTPLSWAAKDRQGGVVKLLLEQEGVNPDNVDTKYGRTPLSLAAQYGHEGVVRMIVEREGVNPDHADTEYGRTPLSLAAEYGSGGVVKILLEQEGVNPDHVDIEYGLTPLLWAAQRGHEGVVKMLLERGVNPDHVDTKQGRTPLSLAAKYGREGVVKMLLETEGVNPDAVDTIYGRTPLSLAAQYGHEGVVKMLLEREGVNPDHADTGDGRTPLSWAAQCGCEGVVKILLERGVNPDHVDTKYGRTSLSWAAERGHEEVVQTLLERDGVDPGHIDTYHRTPLLWAAEGRREGLVNILRTATLGYNNQTTLSFSLSGERARAAGILHERVNTDSVTSDHSDETVLQSADPREGQRILDREEPTPDPADGSSSSTALSRLSQPSFLRRVKLWRHKKWNKQTLS